MPGTHPRFTTVTELVALLHDQADRPFVEPRQGGSSPWDWLARVDPGRQGLVGEALTQLVTMGDPYTSYALELIVRSGSEVRSVVWQRLATIGPPLNDLVVPGNPHGVLATLMRSMLTNTLPVPDLPDDAVSFLIRVAEEGKGAWHLALLHAAAARPDLHGTTLARAVSRMSDRALEEVIMTMMIRPDPFLKQPMDAIAALDDISRMRFGRVLEGVTDLRASDRAFLLGTSSDPARREQLISAEEHDLDNGLDWPTLKARLRL